MTTNKKKYSFSPSVEDKKIINQHIDYVNHCSNYLSGTVLILEDYNLYVNKAMDYYVSANYDIDKIKAIEGFHKPIVLKDEKREQWKAYKWTIELLEQGYTQLISEREKSTTTISALLKKSIDVYQDTFNELREVLEELAQLSNDEELFFKSSASLFKSSYDLLTTYKEKQKELIHIHDQFQQTTQQLFAEKELPTALQRNKTIAFAVKGIVLSIRNEDKKQLQKYIDVYEKNISIKNTDKDYKEVADFGNYLKYRAIKIPDVPERSEWIYKVALSYLNDKSPFMNNYHKKTYNYKKLAIDFFHDHGSGFAKFYNDSVNKAHLPVLHITQELIPFKVQLITLKEIEEKIKESLYKDSAYFKLKKRINRITNTTELDEIVEKSSNSIIDKTGIVKTLESEVLALKKASFENLRRERTRIAQELHDSIGGNLASIKLQLDNFNNSTLNYDKIVNQVNETYEQVRDMSHNLIPKKFIQNPFTTLIEEYIENLNHIGNHRISCNLYPEEELNKIEENLQVEIYKMIQELLTNTIKHAKANEITIQLNYIENGIKLLFEDNGIGFLVSKNKLGVGLTSIKNRLKKYNGELHIDSVPERGTIVNIDIPILK